MELSSLPARLSTLPIFVRSLICFAASSVTFVVYAVLTPLLALPRGRCLAIIKSFIRLTLWYLETFAGLGYEIRGLEHRPTGAALIACKHQSAWETLALQIIIDDPAIVLKRELTWVPITGWVMRRLGHICIDRSGSSSTVADLVRDARVRLAEGRAVVIFPEGSRRLPLAPPDYKAGVAVLYTALKTPCIPVALNSGLFWPRRSMMRFPGRIVIQFLPPIEPGMRKTAFLAELTDRIEVATARLTRAATGGP